METGQKLLPLRQASGPTRWGNQLNGNLGLRSSQTCSLAGPTRWGNQLNGNAESMRCQLTNLTCAGPTRWGNQLNGNYTAYY